MYMLLNSCETFVEDGLSTFLTLNKNVPVGPDKETILRIKFYPEFEH